MFLLKVILLLVMCLFFSCEKYKYDDRGNITGHYTGERVDHYISDSTNEMVIDTAKVRFRIERAACEQLVILSFSEGATGTYMLCFSDPFLTPVQGLKGDFHIRWFEDSTIFMKRTVTEDEWWYCNAKEMRDNGFNIKIY